MALIVNTGSPRQGKTLFAIAIDVVEALAKGQKVRGNIEGWGDPERIEKLRQYVIKAKGLPADFEIDLGFIPHSAIVKGERVFPFDTGTEDEAGTRVFSDEGCMVPFGALLVWDEATKFTTDELPKSFREVITYHGHWATETHPFNILLIYQHWAGLAPIVRSNAEVVRLFKKRPNGKSFLRWTLNNPGDVSRLPLTGGGVVRDELKLVPEIAETYKSTRTDVVANDSVKVRFLDSPFFKKYRKLLIICAVVFVVGQAWAINNFINKSGANLDAGGGSGGAASNAVGASAAPLVSKSEPAIVGVIPTETGALVMIQDGDEYLTLDGRGFTGSGRALRGQYKGKEVVWRGAM